MDEHEEAGLSEAFWAVARRLRHLTKDALAPWQITPSQSRALHVLGRQESLRLNELADQLRIAPRSATEVVDDLQAAGLAERHPDPADRRAVLVTLTDEGVRVSRDIREARQAAGERFFATLSADDRAELGRLLRRLRADAG